MEEAEDKSADSIIAHVCDASRSMQFNGDKRVLWHRIGMQRVRERAPSQVLHFAFADWRPIWCALRAPFPDAPIAFLCRFAEKQQILSVLTYNWCKTDSLLSKHSQRTCCLAFSRERRTASLFLARLRRYWGLRRSDSGLILYLRGRVVVIGPPPLAVPPCE